MHCLLPALTLFLYFDTDFASLLITSGVQMKLHEAFQPDVLKSGSFLEALNVH